MEIEYLEAAQDELFDAFAWYDEHRPGLGSEFLQEVKKTILKISRNPEAWRKMTGSTRRCRTQRFPCGIVCERSEKRILIIAVMHLHRKPNYWKDRLK